MITRSWELLISTWSGMVLGTGLVLAGGAAGWLIGRYHSFAAVRLVSWWVTRVIVPLLKASSISRRAVAIFLNNVCVLSVILATGLWHRLAIVAVIGLGVSLGIGLQCLTAGSDEFSPRPAAYSPGARRRLRIGVALNLLEPPAIVATVGLCLQRQILSVSPLEVWEAFVVWVVPAMLVAACGEALWLGECLQSPQGEELEATDTPGP